MTLVLPHPITQQPPITIQPESTLIFYRNDFKSSASIKITKRQRQIPAYFYIKCTNPTAYRVSDINGMINQHQLSRKINVYINQDTPLEQCLYDRFKVRVELKNYPPIQRVFKVIIDYQNEVAKKNNKDNANWQMVSKTSESTKKTMPSIISKANQFTMKKFAAKSNLTTVRQDKSNQEIVLKHELHKLDKSVQWCKFRLGSLNNQVSRGKSKKRLNCCIMFIILIIGILIGILVKRLASYGRSYYDLNIAARHSQPSFFDSFFNMF